MAKLSENELAELTGKDRRTIKRRLDGIECENGAHGARLYESAVALQAIYGYQQSDNGEISLEKARARQAVSQAELNAIRTEIERKHRIPIQVCEDVDDEVFQYVASTLKAHKGKTLTEEMINAMFESFRSIPERRKW